MNRRLSGGDASLNAPLRSDGESEWQDWLVDESPNQETILADREEKDDRSELLAEGMKALNERERAILTARRLKDEPATLEDLSKEFDISRERVRQIEVRAFEKLQRAIRELLTDLPFAGLIGDAETISGVKVVGTAIGDGKIIDAIIDFFKSPQGQALIEALIKLILSLLAYVEPLHFWGSSLQAWNA